MQIPISSIVVFPNRQRKELGDITGLAASIRANGLIQPIVVTILPDGNYKLQAGERRLRAHQNLTLTHIEARLLDDLSPAQQELIELEENVRRKELTWPELVRATERFVELGKAENKTAKEISADLQLPESTISKMCTTAKALEEMPRLATAASWSSAYTAYSTEKSKQMDNLVEDILGDVAAAPVVDFEETPAAPAPVIPLSSPAVREALGVPEPSRYAQLQSFLEWAPEYTGRRFNLVHCDFPYGLAMDTSNLQGSSTRWELENGRYADSPELFEQLLRTFIKHRDKFIAESAHVIFWTAHKNYSWAERMFSAAGFNVCEVPLIWHKSDGAGIAPDVTRQPRRTYEIALFASRGDRKIAKVKAASFSSPTTKVHHLSEKPLAVVTHFLEMLCDAHTELLDPTCGSGTALEAALRLGARRVVGLDVLQPHVDYTNRRCAGILSSGDLADLDLPDV